MRLVHTDRSGCTVFAMALEASPPGNRYVVSGPGTLTDSKVIADLRFQNGSPATNGINGLTIEQLLAICIDRTRVKDTIVHSDANDEAIAAMQLAFTALDSRHQDRVDRGVAGTPQT